MSQQAVTVQQVPIDIISLIPKKATISIPLNPVNIENVLDSKCITLFDDGEDVFRENTMESRLNRIIRGMYQRMGLSQTDIDILTQLMFNDFNQIPVYLPNEQCIVAPPPPMGSEKNVLRILGHHKGDYYLNEQERENKLVLMVSNKQLPRQQTGEECLCICRNMPDEECMLVTPEQSSPLYNSIKDQRNGRHTVIWLLHNVEGQKYIRAFEGRFQVFSVFRDVIQSQAVNSNKKKVSSNVLRLTLVPNEKEVSSNALRLNLVPNGVTNGKSYHNVLLQAKSSDSRDHGQPSQVDDSGHFSKETGDSTIPLSVNPLVEGDVTMPIPRRLSQKSRNKKARESVEEEGKVNTESDEMLHVDNVNVVVTMKQRARNAGKVRVDLIPLIHDNDELREQEVKECIIDRHHKHKCNVHVRSDMDYDIRIENIGSEVVDVEVFAMDIPRLNPEPLVPQGHFGSCQLYLICVLLVGIFGFFMNRRNKRRERRRVMAGHPEWTMNLVEPEAYTMQ